MNRREVIIAIILIVAVALSVRLWWWIRPLKLAVLEHRRTLIADLAEMIIPRTDTPGAKDANVTPFILEMVRNGISKQEGRTFLNGLDAIDEHCHTLFGHGFVASTEEEKVSALAHFESLDEWTNVPLLAKVRNKLLGRPFFPLLKYLTVVGYCTSEVGCRQGLAYDYVPHEYLPCIPLKDGQRAWATV